MKARNRFSIGFRQLELFPRMFLALMMIAISIDPAGYLLASPRDLEGETSPYALYDQTQDELFPHKILGESPSEFVLSLRYMPSFGPESQIVISKKLQGGYTVTLYHLPLGSKNIGQQFSEIQLKSKALKPFEIAKEITVLVENVNVPPALISRQLDRISQVRISPIKELDIGIAHLDGTGYQFYLEPLGGPDVFTASYAGETYGKSNKRHQLVSWMNEMNALVGRYAQKSTLVK